MTTNRAVVLGAGGLVGTGWLAGLANGLRRHGVNLTEADLIVGTSAGAIVGAMLATGQDLDPLGTFVGADTPTTTETSTMDSGVLAEVFAVMGDPTMSPAATRRKAGELALAADTMTEAAHISQMGALITARDWPQGALRVTAVDTETGDQEIWDRTKNVPLLAAVASSCAVPGVYPPITINGRRYIDGGFYSPTNANLAADARVLLVIQPLAHQFPSDILDRELAVAGAETILRIVPDSASVQALGTNLQERANWPVAYQAGQHQATEAAALIRDAWHGAADTATESA
jgi:NTE family protein